MLREDGELSNCASRRRRCVGVLGGSRSRDRRACLPLSAAAGVLRANPPLVRSPLARVLRQGTRVLRRRVTTNPPECRAGRISPRAADIPTVHTKARGGRTSLGTLRQWKLRAHSTSLPRPPPRSAAQQQQTTATECGTRGSGYVCLDLVDE